MTAYTRLETVEDLERALTHVQWLRDLTAGYGRSDDPPGWLDVAASSIYRELVRARSRHETLSDAEAIRRRVLATWRGDTPPPGRGAEYGPELVARAGSPHPSLAGADLVADAGDLWDRRAANVAADLDDALSSLRAIRTARAAAGDFDAPAGAGDSVEAYRG